MSENVNSNNIENDEFNLINEDSDYKDLITKLVEISFLLRLVFNKKIKFIEILFFLIKQWLFLSL